MAAALGVWLPGDMWQCIAGQCIAVIDDAGVVALALTCTHVRAAVLRVCARLPGMRLVLATAQRMTQLSWRTRIFNANDPALQTAAVPWNIDTPAMMYMRCANLAARLGYLPVQSRELLLALFAITKARCGKGFGFTQAIKHDRSGRAVLVCLLLRIMREVRPDDAMNISGQVQCIAAALIWEWNRRVTTEPLDQTRAAVDPVYARIYRQLRHNGDQLHAQLEDEVARWIRESTMLKE